MLATVKERKSDQPAKPDSRWEAATTADFPHGSKRMPFESPLLRARANRWSFAPFLPMNYLGGRLAFYLDEIVLRPANRDHHTEFYFVGNSQKLAELAFHKHVESGEGCAQTEGASRYYQVLRRRVER